VWCVHVCVCECEQHERACMCAAAQVGGRVCSAWAALKACSATSESCGVGHRAPRAARVGGAGCKSVRSLPPICLPVMLTASVTHPPVSRTAVNSAPGCGTGQPKHTPPHRHARKVAVP